MRAPRAPKLPKVPRGRHRQETAGSEAYRPIPVPGGAGRRANQSSREEVAYRGQHTRRGQAARARAEAIPADPFDVEPSRPGPRRRSPAGPARARFGQMPRVSPTDLAAAYPGAQTAAQRRRSEELQREYRERQAELVERERHTAARGRGATMRKASQGGALGRAEAGHRSQERTRERGNREFLAITDRELAAQARATARGRTGAAIESSRRRREFDRAADAELGRKVYRGRAKPAARGLPRPDLAPGQHIPAPGRNKAGRPVQVPRQAPPRNQYPDLYGRDYAGPTRF